MVECGAERMAKGQHDRQRGQRFADDNDYEGRDDGPRLTDKDGRIEQHAHGNEKEHGERIAQGQRLLGSALAQLGFTQDHASEEGAEREGDTEELGGAERESERDDQDAQPEELARSGVGDVVQHPRYEALSEHQHDGHEGCDLAAR